MLCSSNQANVSSFLHQLPLRDPGGYLPGSFFWSAKRESPKRNRRAKRRKSRVQSHKAARVVSRPAVPPAPPGIPTLPSGPRWPSLSLDSVRPLAGIRYGIQSGGHSWGETPLDPCPPSSWACGPRQRGKPLALRLWAVPPQPEPRQWLRSAAIQQQKTAF